MKVLVTGANGFIGRNLCLSLARRADVELIRFDLDTPARSLDQGLAEAELVFHLAGVDLPDHVEDFHKGNAELTRKLCARLAAVGSRAKVVFSSSAQAELDTPYGISKRAAEESIHAYAEKTGAAGVVYRLASVFGKWDRAHHSLTANLCHEIANGRSVELPDAGQTLELCYIDDVVTAFTAELGDARGGFRLGPALPSHPLTLGELAALLRGFRDARQTLLPPDFTRPLIRALYATYLSHLPTDGFGCNLAVKTDPRGRLADFIKQPCFGQISVSRTHPGTTRGNHYHQTTVERLLVVEGEAIVRFRHSEGGDVITYPVRGEDFRVIDVPPGYTHAIENVGPGELVTLVWASEIFDDTRPDTVFLPVLKQGQPT